jgi:hypothetical protein
MKIHKRHQLTRAEHREEAAECRGVEPTNSELQFPQGLEDSECELGHSVLKYNPLLDLALSITLCAIIGDGIM